MVPESIPPVPPRVPNPRARPPVSPMDSMFQVCASCARPLAASREGSVSFCPVCVARSHVSEWDELGGGD